jgi:flagellar export protein FliJ
MAKFKFRLATLLRLRELARDERRGQLAQAYRAQEILEEQKRQLEEHLTELRRGARFASGPGEINVDRLLEARRFETVLLAQRQDVDRKQEAIGREVERRRQALVEANREVLVLENLRARQQERHRAEEGRRETKNLDEIALQRALREERP